jgi:hypothetical protein
LIRRAARIDRRAVLRYGLRVTRSPETEKFLRAAVKTGLRMQHRAAADAGARGPVAANAVSEGVATLQRIKASLRKRHPNPTKL